MQIATIRSSPDEGDTYVRISRLSCVTLMRCGSPFTETATQLAVGRFDRLSHHRRTHKERHVRFDQDVEHTSMSFGASISISRPARTAWSK